MTPLYVTCPGGIGDRLSAIANALTRSQSVLFGWKRNTHCPIDAAEIWPEGIPSVAFEDSGGPMSVTRFDGHPCHSHAAALDRQISDSKLLELIALIHASPLEDPPTVAVFFRGRAAPASDPLPAARLAASRAGQEGRVFLMADSQRQEIAEELLANGAIPVWPRSPEMSHDTDRDGCTFHAFLGDWKTLCLARFVASHARRFSSLLLPVLAGNATIEYA